MLHFVIAIYTYMGREWALSYDIKTTVFSVFQVAITSNLFEKPDFILPKLMFKPPLVGAHCHVSLLYVMSIHQS